MTVFNGKRYSYVASIFENKSIILRYPTQKHLNDMPKNMAKQDHACKQPKGNNQHTCLHAARTTQQTRYSQIQSI